VRQGELEIVGTYRFAHEATLARATLAAYGVEAWVFDETLAQLHGYTARGAGAVKLTVSRADAGTAREILDGDHSADLASVPEARIPPGPDELCPRCGSDALERVNHRTATGALLAMLGLREKWRCRACGR
jgi:hypothetical protein